MPVTVRIALAIALAIVLRPTAAQAQAADDRQLIQDLIARVQALEAEVKALKDAQARPAEAQPAASTTPTEMGLGGGAGPRLEIHGFADLDYLHTDESLTHGSFTLGQLDLFMSSALSDNTSVVGELVTEADDDNVFHVDLERLMLQFKPSDYLNIGVGRYHTAIGYYNTAYHHGTWFQTATGRPFLFRFEDQGGPLPVHGVGVTINGRIPSGRLGLRYVAEVGNGRASRSPLAQEPVQNVVDDQNHKAFNLALFARPESIRGLQVGFSVYRDLLAPINSPRIGETILAAHAVFVRPRFEWLNEALVVRHAIFGTSQVFNTPGFYTQFSRQLGSYRPYFRYQYINASGTEPVFPDVRLRQGPSVGLRYDASESVALKLQYDYTDSRARAARNALALQVGFTF